MTPTNESSRRAQAPSGAAETVAPTGDELRAIARSARTSASDPASPEELVQAGWKAAIARFGAPPATAPAESFQLRVQPWMMACFGEMIAGDREERNHRFLEEALELVQSTGCTASEAHQLVDYVYGRPVGEPAQEVGGVMVTLAALCLANGLDMHDAAEVELARIWTKVEAIRAKQAAKPKHSPLPAAPAAQASQPVTLSNSEILQAAAELRGVPWRIGGRSVEVLQFARKVLALAAPVATTQPAAHRAAEATNFNAGVEAAAKWVDKRRNDYMDEHGSYDLETGGTGLSCAGQEYVGELEEIAEGLRSLLPCDRPSAGWLCTRPRGHTGQCAAMAASPVNRERPRGKSA
ncbi:hypothetical protein [Xylophilus sp. GOD-11R]|uniref:hypothetical protein n=1 Tax=Xylophilus sp. GOD-11R TaxID=3089814 RepID=UPI00298CDECA|nr:hypothetical protein [Xylophilus sp. GOD-11R]WPB58601.1 hypothetical protein R9X41_08190 [Xylophilus sp. GOD-11R]